MEQQGEQESKPVSRPSAGYGKIKTGRQVFLILFLVTGIGTLFCWGPLIALSLVLNDYEQAPITPGWLKTARLPEAFIPSEEEFISGYHEIDSNRVIFEYTTEHESRDVYRQEIIRELNETDLEFTHEEKGKKDIFEIEGLDGKITIRFSSDRSVHVVWY